MSSVIAKDRYLQVPVDESRELMSPPCSPVPVDWQSWVEDPPAPWIEEFDLESSEGLVHLGGDEYVKLSPNTATIDVAVTDHRRTSFIIRRRGTVLAKRIAGYSQNKRIGISEVGQANTQLPPIIVDSYE